MSKKWPVHKVFRTPQQNDLHAQRSPSPIVEMPLSPDAETASSTNNGSSVGPRFPSSVERSLSPRRSQSPFSSPLNKGVREIPIEVEHEVTKNNVPRIDLCKQFSFDIFLGRRIRFFHYFVLFCSLAFAVHIKNWRHIPSTSKHLFHTHSQPSIMLNLFFLHLYIHFHIHIHTCTVHVFECANTKIIQFHWQKHFQTE